MSVGASSASWHLNKHQHRRRRIRSVCFCFYIVIFGRARTHAFLANGSKSEGLGEVWFDNSADVSQSQFIQKLARGLLSLYLIKDFYLEAGWCLVTNSTQRIGNSLVWSKKKSVLVTVIFRTTRFSHSLKTFNILIFKFNVHFRTISFIF